MTEEFKKWFREKNQGRQGPEDRAMISTYWWISTFFNEVADGRQKYWKKHQGRLPMSECENLAFRDLVRDFGLD